MANTVASAQVMLWGTQVGTVIWHNSLGYFEYDKKLLGSGIELSPLQMPLADRAYSFSALSHDTYKGLPGLLADSLPDKFGNRLIDQWLERQGRAQADFSPIDRLCYIGNRGMGALEFKPSQNHQAEQSMPLEVSELVVLANDALSSKQRLSTALGEDDLTRKQAVQQIISVGTSAGGARAKAVIAWNQTTNEVRSGQVNTDPGFDYWLLKFDGVEENRDHESLADPQGFSIVEYAYYLMAKAAGIDMSQCRLFHEHGRAHFMTHRFDRLDGGEKLHMQSLCGLAHFDFNQSGGYSYEQAFGVLRDLRLPNPAFKEFYRRMVFNIIARNQDDHTKNISFLMDKRGQWRLSPAYDITHCNGQGWTRQHQMTVNGKQDNFTLDDLIATARHGDLSRSTALGIINEVLNAVKQWPTFASQAGVPDIAPGGNPDHSWQEAIGQDHRTQW